MLNILTLLAASEAGGAVKRNVRAVGYFAVAACTGLIGLVFLLVAARDALLPQMGLVMANLSVGGAMLLLGLVFLLVGQSVRKRRNRSSAFNSTAAIVAAPLAARVVGKGINVATLSIAGVMLAGAAIGHYLANRD